MCCYSWNKKIVENSDDQEVTLGLRSKLTLRKDFQGTNIFVYTMIKQLMVCIYWEKGKNCCFQFQTGNRMVSEEPYLQCLMCYHFPRLLIFYFQ